MSSMRFAFRVMITEKTFSAEIGLCLINIPSTKVTSRVGEHNTETTVNSVVCTLRKLLYCFYIREKVFIRKP